MKRNRSTGVKYPLTVELKSLLQSQRRKFNISSEEMAGILGLDSKNTYTNLEKLSGSTTITSDILHKFFKELKIREQAGSKSFDEYVIVFLEKYLDSQDLNILELDNQDWLKAYYLKCSRLYLSDQFEARILQYFSGDTNCEKWRNALESLNLNRHIKLKTKITIPGEIYINLGDKYPDWGGKPFWCMYFKLSEQDIDYIIKNISDYRKINYCVVISLLVSLEVERRQKKDYDEIYENVYNELYMYDDIFSIIDNIKANRGVKETVKNSLSQLETESNNILLEKLSEIKDLDLPQNISQLVDNCLSGKEAFLNSINVDFTPLFNLSKYDIEVFRIRLMELVNNLSNKN